MTHDTHLTADAIGFAKAVLKGLSARQKSLPCQYFYDERGSRLFEEITRLPEYYPTRTEIEILSTHAAEMTRAFPPGSILIEFGSGSSRKTEILLRARDDLRAYVPIDVSASALNDANERLGAAFPHLRICPIVGDFRARLRLPQDLAACPRVGFFPGSTIGNFEPGEAIALLQAMRAFLRANARLLIGVDLRKNTQTLIPAYDDRSGVTAAFNKNLLVRVNRELGADFDLDAFKHRAIFNAERSRIEMHLASETDQVVTLLGQRFAFRSGETIHTENSHKYTPESFSRLASAAGWTSARLWTDPARLFSVHELTA